MLSLQEFDILNFLFKNQDKEYTQEEISNNTKISLEKFEEILEKLKNNEIIDKYFNITEKDFVELDP